MAGPRGLYSALRSQGLQGLLGFRGLRCLPQPGLTLGPSFPTGDLLIIMAQIIISIQMVLEEKFVYKHSVHPLRAVGTEGACEHRLAGGRRVECALRGGTSRGCSEGSWRGAGGLWEGRASRPPSSLPSPCSCR